MNDTMHTAVRAGVAGSLGAAGLMVYAVRSRSSTFLGPSVYRGDRRRHAVALTFDDGPSEVTPDILDILCRHGARATFFQIGANVERLPEISREVARSGHEIGNHSHTHPLFCFRSPQFIEDDFARAQQAIARITGCVPRLMRAPYGARWPGFRRMQQRLHLLGVMWTVIGYDWRLQAGAVVRRVLRATANGGIICLHDGRELDCRPDRRATVEAVRILVPALRERGYELETVSQILCPTK
jgi:peptidoglycan-N-acetylglucosamine deacetylase